MPTPLTVDGSPSRRGGGVASAARLVMIAAVDASHCLRERVEWGSGLGLAEHSRRGSGLDAVALGGTLGELVGRWSVAPPAARERRSSSSGNSSTTCATSCTTSGALQASPGLQ